MSQPKFILSFQNHFKDNKNYLLIASVVFFVSLFLGFLIAFIFPGILDSFLNLLTELFSSELESFAENPKWQSSLMIFSRNFRVSLLLSFGGFFLGLFPIISLFINGFIVGLMIGILFLSGALILILTSLVPHAIFEIPAIIISSALGIRLGLEWLLRKSKGHRDEVFKTNLMRIVKFLPVIFFLLLFAGFVEVYVSGTLSELISP